MDCYNCGTILNRKTRSAEHILPNSIGGKRKAYNLLCKACNEKFGRTIDNELASKLTRFYSLLVQGSSAHKTKTASGNRKDGNIASHDRFLAAVQANRTFSGSTGSFQAIAKICLNYYLSKGYPKQYCEAIKAFIRGENKDHLFHYYAPEIGSVHTLEENEVSHILHIHGDAASGALYAYIELFNMQNLIFIFTMEYHEKDIDVTYCRDIIKDEELSKKIALGLTRDQLEKLEISSAVMEERLFPRFERLLKMINDQ